MADDRPGAVVVLGVFFAHRHPALLRSAARRGLAVLGVDRLDRTNTGIDAARRRDPDHPLAGLADLAWLPSDRGPAVIDRVRLWSRDYDIRAVAVIGEDFVETGGLVADCFGLRGPGLRASRVCRNKLLQRRFLAEWSPRSRLVPPGARDAATSDWDLFPAVVKPVGRTASSGVRRVHNAAELRAAVAGFGAAEAGLVEELVEDPELSVESLVSGGRVVFASPTGKRTNEADGTHFVELGHTVPHPALSPETTRAVLDVNAKVLARLGFRDGSAHAEFRVGPDGRVTLMEIAARMAGDAVPGLYHLATGTPLEETLLAILLGEPAEHPAPRRVARQVFLPHEPGILRAVRTEGLDVAVCSVTEQWAWPEFVPAEADAPGKLHMVVASRPPGTELGPIRESVERCVTFVIDAPTLAELDRLEAECRTGVQIEIEPRAAAEGQPEPLAPQAPPAVLLLGDPAGEALGDGPAPLVISELASCAAAADSRLLSPINLTEIVDQAVTWSGRYAIAGVRALDKRYLEAAALVADLLGLPSPGLRAARVCGDEALQRSYLADWIAHGGQTGEGGYSVTSHSLDGEIRDIEITADRCADPTAKLRRQLSETHEAVLRHLAFVTGAARADYRGQAGQPPELLRIAIVP